MTIRSLALLASSAALGLACATTALDTDGAFAFEVDGRTYGILGTGPAGERANELVSLEGPVRLRARDRDQDGRLDTLLVGDLPLAEADAIYARGIAIARAAGAYAERVPPRTFATPDGPYTLVVWSVASGGADWENRFVMYEGAQSGQVFVDADADGVLDDAPDAQDAYARALSAGRRAGRVEVVDERYRVRARSAPGDAP